MLGNFLCKGTNVIRSNMIDHFRLKVLLFQRVTVAARSIVGTSGAGLKPSILELQAIVVALKPDGFPDAIPKPSKYVFRC